MKKSFSSSEIWKRFGAAAILTTIVCLPVAAILLRVTGVPPTFPPLLPLQIIAGTVGGAFLATAGYGLLSLFIREHRKLFVVFCALGIVLLIASFHLPYRLSYTSSPRFAGVTLAAQIGQGFLHTLVVGLSMACFRQK